MVFYTFFLFFKFLLLYNYVCFSYQYLPTFDKDEFSLFSVLFFFLEHRILVTNNCVPFPFLFNLVFFYRLCKQARKKNEFFAQKSHYS